jgi:hypothetical protein
MDTDTNRDMDVDVDIVLSRRFVPFDVFSFDVLSHSVFLHSTFCPIRRFVPFGVFSIRRFFQLTFCPIRPFVPFDVSSIRRFLPFGVFSIQCFVPFGVCYFDILSVNRLGVLNYCTVPGYLTTSSLIRNWLVALGCLRNVSQQLAPIVQLQWPDQQTDQMYSAKTAKTIVLTVSKISNVHISFIGINLLSNI